MPEQGLHFELQLYQLIADATGLCHILGRAFGNLANDGVALIDVVSQFHLASHRLFHLRIDLIRILL